MLRKKLDIGIKFGMLLVLEESESRFYVDKRDGYKKRIRRVRCKCDCGNIIDRDYGSLPKQIKRGQISSCGCNNNKPKEITKDVTFIPNCKTLPKKEKRDILKDLINKGYTNKEITLKTGFSGGFISRIRTELGKLTFTKFKDIKPGEVFNRITVIEILPSDKRHTTVLGKCECGNLKSYRYSHLKSGNVKSCGCLMKEVARDMMINKLVPNNIKHGDKPGTKHRYLYELWIGMKQRCYNPKNKRYKTYGQRGIKVYEPWINDYVAFKDYILTNLGERYNAGTGKREDNESLDRIDVNKGYEPGNLRWADFITQANNKFKKTIHDYKTRPQLENEGKKLLGAKKLHVLYKGYYGVDVKNKHVVHHINWNPDDNSKENLLMVSRREHGWLHQNNNHILRSKSREELIEILSVIDWNRYEKEKNGLL